MLVQKEKEKEIKEIFETIMTENYIHFFQLEMHKKHDLLAPNIQKNIFISI